MPNKLLEKSKNYQKIEKTIKYIDKNFDKQPSLEELANHINMSKYHFLRVFKKFVGVTPNQFLQVLTLEFVKKNLVNSKTILGNSLNIGFSTTSKLHNLFVNIEAITPNEYKSFGKNLTITYGIGFSSFGKVLIAFTERGVNFLEFIDNDKELIFLRLNKIWQNANLKRDDKLSQIYLDDIFLNNKKCKIFLKGTNFQINVWKALLNIPSGMVTNYENIATILGKPKATRAVASAIASNHIAYLIPCHRVILKSGIINNYRWGFERKKIIFAYENLYTEEIK